MMSNSGAETVCFYPLSALELGLYVLYGETQVRKLGIFV